MVIDQDDNASTWASETSRRLASLALQASNVCHSKTHMIHLLLAPFASHLYELSALVKEMQRETEIRGFGFPISSIQAMESHLKAAEQLVQNYSGRCSLYLLMCFPDLLAQLKHSHTHLEATLDSFCRNAGLSASLKSRCSDEMQALQQSASIKLGPKEQSLHDSLEQGVLDSIVTDSSLTIKLAKQIADALGFRSINSEGFVNEVSELKMEKDAAERRCGMAHSLYLQQFIILLEKAMAACAANNNCLPHSITGDDKVHLSKGGSGAGRGGCTTTPAVLRDTLVLPLNSFTCNISKELMSDPVQIASGQTYERHAIETWFADGNTTCPTTGVELANTNVKPNIALKQSIAEWKERNNTIRLDVATEAIHCGSKEDQLKSLQDLQALCQEDSLYKYKVASKSLVPPLVDLADSNDVELRINALSFLGLLAENEECQALMMKEKAIDRIVKCLAGQNEEAAECVQLMRNLSSNQEVAQEISRAPSAVLFLVTLIQDEHCADNVKAILENLPQSDENVVIMAEANIMKPLLDRLNHGEGASKILMARTLGRLHLPDSSKSAAATEETMGTLARMAESSREEEREAAVMALESLSCVAAARQGLRRVDDALGILLRVMKGVRHSETTKRGAAATLANLWAADEFTMREAEVEEAVQMILELLGPPTPVQVQVCMLQGLLALARSTSEKVAQATMEANDAFTCLLRLFNGIESCAGDEPASTTQLLCCPCLELLTCLAISFREEAARSVRANSTVMHGLANLIRFDNPREVELLAATSFLACLPSRDAGITRLVLQESNLLPALMRLVKNHRNEAVVEAAAGALLRFTIPEDTSMQTTLAKAGIIDTYVMLLQSGGALSKERAGRALYNFSKSSQQLSHGVEEASQVGGRLSGCLAWRQRSARRLSSWCVVHGGPCSVKGTFCLVVANAVGPLVEVVKGEEGTGAQAAALMALATLVEEGDVKEGCGAIERAGGWGAIIGMMSSSTPMVQEKAAHLCEKLFGMENYRMQYAGRAQMHIITLAQRGTPPLKHLAGRLLRHLNLLHSQSNYFGAASTSLS